jgi:Fur family peroxide stress response transcriptional regulator
MNHDLNKAMEKLSDLNIILTPQRYAVLEYLYSSSTHPTVRDIYKGLIKKHPNINVTTIYSNLRVFKKLGLVNELTYGSTSSRYNAAC